MRINKILIILLLLTSLQILNIAQSNKREREAPVREELNNYFQVNYNGMYKIADIIDIDSLKGDTRFINIVTIQNPYGMLTNSFVFVTYFDEKNHTGNEEKNRVGIYKEGNIIWISEPVLPNYSSYGSIFAIDDINMNGSVEIVIMWGSKEVELWILSWDGIDGKVINEAPYHSAIQGNIFRFSMFDIEGDGIQEIVHTFIDDSHRVWSWNGNKYGIWANTPQLPQGYSTIFPANNFIPQVKCVVKKENEKYVYNYTVKNDETSKQRIDEFNIARDGSWEIKLVKNPKNWERVGNGWNTEVLNNGNLIWPGESQSNFGFAAKGLPGITNFSSLADNTLPGDSEMSSSELGELNRRYRKENLVWGKTIGSKALLTPFIPTEFLDTLINYTTQSYELGWITDQTTRDKYLNYFNTAKTSLENSDTNSASNELLKVLTDVDNDSSTTLSSEAYALLKYNTDYLLEQLPETSAPSLVVKLTNSTGSLLTDGSLKYYEAGWKDAEDFGNGIFGVNTERTTLSLKMTYAYGSQQINNVTVGADTAVFQTVNTVVTLLNSQNGFIVDPSTGQVKYYAGGWRAFGTTVNGEVSKELLPNNYSFRMTYAFGSNDKQQNLNDSTTVVFQTVNTEVQLQDSQGSLMPAPMGDEGTVKYYSGGWRDFGITVNGTVTKELLPNNYSFRMTYAFGNKDKQQNLNDSTTVVFKTVNTEVQLQDSQGSLMPAPMGDEGAVKYYSGGWRDFGITVNGAVSKELLPNNYSFRMTYAFGSNDKQQNLNDNSTVVFQTVNTEVQLQDNQGSLMPAPMGDEGAVKYYSGGWRDFGTTLNGTITKELLPNNYSFRMTYAFGSNDKQQNLNDNSTVVFQTVNTSVQLKDSQGSLIDEGTVKYYSGGWRDFGTTVNGAAAKELLPNNYSFRMTYAFGSNDKQQNLNDNSTVVFQTVNTSVQLKDSQGSLLDEGAVKYYSGGWRDFGTTTNGTITKELLPNNYSFRMTHEFISNDKSQNIGDNNVVNFSTVLCVVKVIDSQAQSVDGAEVKYYSGGWRQIGLTTNGEITKELLPKSISFRVINYAVQQDKSQDTSVNNIVEFIME